MYKFSIIITGTISEAAVKYRADKLHDNNLVLSQRKFNLLSNFLEMVTAFRAKHNCIQDSSVGLNIKK